MRKKPKADPRLFEFLPERDMLVVQRRCLLDDHEEKRKARRLPRRPAASPKGKGSQDQKATPAAKVWLGRKDATDTAGADSGAVSGNTSGSASDALPPAHPTKDDPKLPPLLYSFDVIYRYTRGVNDISNPGMGYGELARETRWSKIGGTLSRVDLTLRRTRTGRQEVVLTPDKKPPR
jgi:hypothetical protein